MSSRDRILIVKLSSIGDVVMSLPVAAALRRQYPGAYLAWVVQPAAAGVLTGNPHLNEVLVTGGAQQGARALPPLSSPFTLRRELRALKFTTSLDLQGLLKSAMLGWLSGARERVGYRSWQEGVRICYTRTAPRRMDIHAVDSYLDLAAAVGAARTPVTFDLAVSDEDRAQVAQLLADRGPIATLIPGARWESKLWPPARFAAVADALHTEFGLTSAIIGGPGDTALAVAIAAAASAPLLDLTGKTTLKQAAEVFRRSRLTIGNDTGPLYLSSAVGTPTVAVFGPSDPRRLGPYGPGHAKVVTAVDCAPCRNRQCRDRRCLDTLSPEAVMAAVRSLLRDAGTN